MAWAAMVGALFSLAQALLAPAEAAAETGGRGYAGVQEVHDAREPEEPAGEVLPVPPPPEVPRPAPAKSSVVAARPVEPAAVKREEPAEQRPRRWGPYPRPKLTGFGGPLAQFTGLDGKFAAMVGLGGGISILQRVSIGAQALWLLNRVEAGKSELGARQRLNANYAGLWLAVRVFHRERVDLNLDGVFGGGGACLQNDSGTCLDKTAFFFGQPGVTVHVRLSPIVRLVLGAGYRLVAARGWSGPASVRLGAPVGTLMLEFGWF